MSKNPMKTNKPLRARNKFLREKRDRKRAEAKARQAAYDKLTLEEKIRKLDAGGYAAIKQRFKLTSTLDAVRAVSMNVVGTAVVPEGPVPPKKERKGQKAKRQARKDKKNA